MKNYLKSVGEYLCLVGYKGYGRLCWCVSLQTIHTSPCREDKEEETLFNMVDFCVVYMELKKQHLIQRGSLCS